MCGHLWDWRFLAGGSRRETGWWLVDMRLLCDFGEDGMIDERT